MQDPEVLPWLLRRLEENADLVHGGAAARERSLLAEELGRRMRGG